jgi:DNA-binding PadR family transcriptional regulator
LESEGAVEASMENIGNRIRKYYALTTVGKKQNAVARKEVQNFVETLHLLFKPKLT